MLPESPQRTLALDPTSYVFEEMGIAYLNRPTGVYLYTERKRTHATQWTKTHTRACTVLFVELGYLMDWVVLCLEHVSP